MLTSALTQDNRDHHIFTPLGDSNLLLTRFTMRESLGRPFKARAEVISQHSNDDFEGDLGKEVYEALLGQEVSVKLGALTAESRIIHGICCDVVQQSDLTVPDPDGGTELRFSRFTLTIVPTIWFLGHTLESRSFQQKAVPDIINEVMNDVGYTDYDQNLIATYTKRDFCVQYRESSLAFISRLLEQEGMYYFWKHDDDKHTIFFADDPNSHNNDDIGDVDYNTIHSASTGGEAITKWQVRKRVRTGKYSLRDFDFKHPLTIQEESEELPRDHLLDDLEAYDYEGSYALGKPLLENTDDDNLPDTHIAEIQRYRTVRLQERQASFEIINAESDVVALYSGCTFSLQDPNGELSRTTDRDRGFLITRLEIEATQDYFSADQGPGSQRSTFRNQFTVIPSDTPFRLRRSTPRPIVEGPQTAIVVGPDGEKVWCDEFGRVKIKFHWDRLNESDDQASCWVRVSQMWAGKSWGSLHLPHIGQEVIVEFLEGDPDRPIITGRVYNADQPTSQILPDNKHVSEIRDDFGNALVFDGNEGKEHIRLSSPNHNSIFMLGKSTHKWTASDETEWTSGNSTSVVVGNSKKSTFGNAVTVTQGNSWTHRTGAALSTTVGDNGSVTIGHKLDIFAGGAVSISFGWSWKWSVAEEFEVGSKNFTKTVDKDIKLDAGDQIWLCGGASDKTIGLFDNEAISLTFGSSESTKSTRRNNLVKAGAALAFAGATVGTVVGWIQMESAASDSNDLNQASEDQDALPDRNNQSQQEQTEQARIDQVHDDHHADMDTNYIPYSVGAWVSAVAGIVGAVAGVIGRSGAEKKLTKAVSNLTIDKDGVFASIGPTPTGNTGRVSYGSETAYYWLTDKNCFEVMAGENIILDTVLKKGKDISLDSNQNIFLTAKQKIVLDVGGTKVEISSAKVDAASGNLVVNK